MTIDTHSVVYFINEEYGVVIKATGRTKEVAMWNPVRRGFTDRLGLVEAHFLVHHDRVNGRWTPAHPTYSRTTAVKAAEMMRPDLPAKIGMERARTASRLQRLAELEAKGAAQVAADLVSGWKAREAGYAGL